MKRHEIKSFEGFKDIHQKNIIKIPNCSFILEQDNNNRIRTLTVAKKVDNRDSFYICGCSFEESFTICNECKVNCHSDHSNLIKIDIKKSSEFICKCGVNNHLPPKIKKSIPINFKEDTSKAKKSCYYSEILKYTVSKGFCIYGEKGKVFCCICIEKCFNKIDLSEIKQLPSARNAWSEEGEIYVCECTCIGHESALNFDSKFKKYDDLLLNFNFQVLSKPEPTKNMFNELVINKLMTASKESSNNDFIREFSIIKFLETFFDLTNKNCNKYFYPKEIFINIPLKEVIQQLIKIKNNDNEITTIARAEFASLVFLIFVKKFFIVENNQVHFWTFLNMNILQRNFLLYNLVDMNKTETIDSTNEVKRNIKLLTKVYLEFLDDILKKFETNYKYSSDSFDNYLQIFNKIFKFFIKYNLIELEQKRKYFELVYDIYDFANNGLIIDQKKRGKSQTMNDINKFQGNKRGKSQTLSDEKTDPIQGIIIII